MFITTMTFPGIARSSLRLSNMIPGIHGNAVKKILQRFPFVFTCWLCLAGVTPLFADEKPITVVLFKGDVFLLNKEKQKQPVAIGQTFLRSDYPWIENSREGTLYLQTDRKMVELKTGGVFLLKDLFAKQSLIMDRSLDFLIRFVNPRSYISQPRVRGGSDSTIESDAELFERMWEQLAVESGGGHSDFLKQDLIAMAAWFQQQGKLARVAFLLERLIVSADDSNVFYRQLRMDALQRVTLSEINRELEDTRKTATLTVDPGRHKALLIGINDYDEPSWHSLKTPIRDVRELRSLLIRDYLFEETDIVSLENATFENIISAFNEIKKVTDGSTNLLIYYAGHGYYPPGEDEGYWVPGDAGDPESQRLFIPTSTILSKIRSIQSRHTLVIADSCFSGSLIRTTRGAAVDSRYYRDLSRKKSRQIITSGGLEPVSDEGWGDNSVFAGKLLDILKQKRVSPLSASELALKLRKEVKNAEAIQTPEYGRLHIADDESGEFFFVRKDQELTEEAMQSAVVHPGRQAMEFGLEYAEADEPPIPDMDGYRLNFGFGFHVAVLNYKFSYKDSQGEKKTETDSTRLTGTVMHLGIKRTVQRMRYELQTSFGQMYTSSFECDDEDEQTEFCSKYAESSVSGQYTSGGIFASYNVLPPYKFDVEIGAGFLYQNYRFRKLLDERNLDSSFVSACARFEFSYLENNWFIGERNDFCARVYQLGGTLSAFENDSLSDLQIPFTIKISLIAGYRF